MTDLSLYRGDGCNLEDSIHPSQSNLRLHKIAANSRELLEAFPNIMQMISKT